MNIVNNISIVRNLDAIGRLILPKEIFQTLGIEKKSGLEFFIEDDRLILRRYAPLCYICGDSKDLKHYLGKRICSECAEELTKL